MPYAMAIVIKMKRELIGTIFVNGKDMLGYSV